MPVTKSDKYSAASLVFSALALASFLICVGVRKDVLAFFLITVFIVCSVFCLMFAFFENARCGK